MLLLREELACPVLFGEFCLHKLPKYASIVRKCCLCDMSCSQLCSAYVHGALSRLTPHSHTLHAVSVIVIIIMIKCS